MSIFFYTLVLAKVCHFFAVRMHKNFNGSSRGLYNFFLYSTGIGSLVLYATFLAACFMTTWWMPIAAFIISIPISIIIPKKFMIEFVCALLWPVFLVLSIILMLV